MSLCHCVNGTSCLGLGPQLPPSIAAMLVRMQHDLEAVQMQPTKLAARFSISSHTIHSIILFSRQRPNARLSLTTAFIFGNERRTRTVSLRTRGSNEFGDFRRRRSRSGQSLMEGTRPQEILGGENMFWPEERASKTVCQFHSIRLRAPSHTNF